MCGLGRRGVPECTGDWLCWIAHHCKGGRNRWLTRGERTKLTPHVFMGFFSLCASGLSQVLDVELPADDVTSSLLDQFEIVRL